MARAEQSTQRTRGLEVRATRSPLESGFRVVVRAVPDGGRALARAREYIIARLAEEVLAELEGETGCGQ